MYRIKKFVAVLDYANRKHNVVNIKKKSPKTVICNIIVQNMFGLATKFI